MHPAANPKYRHLTAFRRLAGPVVAACRYPGLRRVSRRQFICADEPSVTAPPLELFDGVLLPGSGTGPGLHRRYRIDIEGSSWTPQQLIAAFVEDPNSFAPTEFATFSNIDDPCEAACLEEGRDVMVRLSGPYDAPVRVIEITEDSVRLQTRKGHIEAGQIRFAASQHGSILRFEINSWGRNAGVGVALLWWAGVAYELQTIMWTHVCRRAGLISGGTGGPVHVRTETLAGNDLGLLGEACVGHKLDEQAS